jgi:hypothetical protein
MDIITFLLMVVIFGNLMIQLSIRQETFKLGLSVITSIITIYQLISALWNIPIGSFIWYATQQLLTMALIGIFYRSTCFRKYHEKELFDVLAGFIISLTQVLITELIHIVLDIHPVNECQLIIQLPVVFLCQMIINNIFARLFSFGDKKVYITQTNTFTLSSHWYVIIEGVGIYDVIAKENSDEPLPRFKAYKEVPLINQIYIPFIQIGFVGCTEKSIGEINNAFEESYKSQRVMNSLHMSCQEFCQKFIYKMHIQSIIIDLKFLILTVMITVVRYRVFCGKIEL